MDTSLVISISAAVIALSALGVSIWQGMLSRKHNRLSVVPHLRVDYSLTTQKMVLVLLSNSGLGPAIIKEFTVLLDSKAIQQVGLHPLVEALLQAGFDEEYFIYTPSLGDAISTSEQHKLISFELEDEQSGLEETIYKIMDRISFNIKYESVYGEEYSLKVSGSGMLI